MPFPKQRLQKVVSQFSSKNIDGFLVTKDVNIRYLTGFPSSDAWLLVTPKKTYYLTDRRYADEVRRAVSGVTVVCYKDSMLQTIAALVQKSKIKHFGFDEHHLTVAAHRSLRKWCPTNTKIVPANHLVETLRERKDPQEIEGIRQALAIQNKILGLCQKWIQPGVTEQDILKKLQQEVDRRGVKFSFTPIIASGPNSAYPHAQVTDRKIRRNDLVLMDFGIDVNGYKSDLTRIFFLGRIPRLIRDINIAVREVQRQSIQMIRPGTPAAAVDQSARNYFKKKNLSQYFSHSLGHGVGLEIHESPRLSSKSRTILLPGMVVTVEPGVYIPGVGGIRIEDMVLVTENGNEVLSEYRD